VFAVPHNPLFVKNANLAGYEAKVCAHNILYTLQTHINQQQQVDKENAVLKVNKELPLPLQQQIGWWTAGMSFVLNLFCLKKSTATFKNKYNNNHDSILKGEGYNQLLKYPEDVFGGGDSAGTTRGTDVLLPLSVCVSLGPHNAVLVMNDLVLGGRLLGRVACLVKHVIEITKMAELRGHVWGRYYSHLL
jgi:hypothetical protein